MATAARAAKPSRNGKAAATVATGSDGADHDATTGRFVRGNQAACGNAFARQVAERRKAILAAVSAEDIGRVAKKLCEMAVGGDVPAAKVLLTFVCGKPQPAPDVDRLDLDELAILLESPDVEQTCRRGQVTPALAVREILRGLVSTPQALLEALEEKFQELREDLQRRAPPGEWLELEDIARDAGLGGDDDEDE